METVPCSSPPWPSSAYPYSRCYIVMQCPGCRKEIAEGSVAHRCGWRRAGATVAPVAAVAPIANLEVARAAIEAARELLARGRVERQRKAVSVLSDVGHGACTCEVCCAERARRRVRAAWLRDRFPV